MNILQFLKKRAKPTKEAVFIRETKDKERYVHFNGKDYLTAKGVIGACIWKNKKEGESFISAFDVDLECVLVSEILK